MGANRFYQEVQGVMTRFELLTPEAVATYGEAGLTLEDVTDSLTNHGLDPQYVVHDPSRQVFNTYYADYERGLYGELFMTREMLDGNLPLFKLAAIAKGQPVAELSAKDWCLYYSKCVPMPLLIYDFQRRYRDIPPQEVFSVWYRIYKRIDYSNGMWRDDVLDYVFSHAPAPELPDMEADGLVTIYRGMGELSQPPERAISWSTHPGNALWFAIHCGRGTHIAVARVRPEQIVAHYAKFYNENEVIVRPGTITEYRYEDMIPETEAAIAPLLAAALPDYLFFGRQAKKLGYKEEGIFQIHGLKHILRVLLLSMIYYHCSGDALGESDRQIMAYFSLLHDIVRTNEERDDAHGMQSVALIHSKGLRIKGLQMSKKDYRIAELLIEHHCHDDAAGETAIRAASGLSRKEKEHTVHLYRICKDMDGLDRVRFNGLDYRLLRTEYARKLPLVAGALLEEQMIQALDMDLPEAT